MMQLETENQVLQQQLAWEQITKLQLQVQSQLQHNNYFNKIIPKDLTDGGAKGKNAILIGIDQRMVNQKGPLLMVTEVMPLEMIEGNKDISNADKRGIS